MKSALLFLITCLFFSCSKREDKTLQEYMATKSQAPDYLSADFNPSMFKPATSSLSSDEQQALKGVEKLNVVAYHNDSIPPAFYKAETARIKKLLSDPQYQELMHVNSGKDGGSVSFVGDDEHIDELILYGKHHKNGFAVVRVIGKDMTPETVYALFKVIRERGFGDIKELQPLEQAIDPTRTFKG